MKKRCALFGMGVVGLVLVYVVFRGGSDSTQPLVESPTGQVTGYIDSTALAEDTGTSLVMPLDDTAADNEANGVDTETYIDLSETMGTPQAALLPDPFEITDTKYVEVETFIKPEDEKCVNVKLCGAVGDGVTDDYDAVLTAYKKASSEGKILFFPAGTYYLSRKIVLNSNISILGEGMNSSSIYFKNSPSKGPIEDYNQRGMITFVSNHLEVKGLSFYYIGENSL